MINRCAVFDVQLESPTFMARIIKVGHHKHMKYIYLLKIYMRHLFKLDRMSNLILDLASFPASSRPDLRDPLKGLETQFSAI